MHPHQVSPLIECDDDVRKLLETTAIFARLDVSIQRQTVNTKFTKTEVQIAATETVAVIRLNIFVGRINCLLYFGNLQIACKLASTIIMALFSQIKPGLWEVALSKIPKEDREALTAGLNLHFNFDDLKSTIEKIRRNAASERRRIRLPLGEINIREHLDKLVSWVQKFIAIGDTIATYDPGHAALPWAAMRFILQLMVNDSTRAAAFIKGLEQTSFYIYDCSIRERLYLVRKTSEDQEQLVGHIVALYTAVLQYMLKVRLFFEASAAKRVISSVYKSADGVIQLLEVIAQHAWQVATVSGRMDSEHQLVTQVLVDDLSESHQRSMVWLQQRLEEDKNTMIDMIQSNHSQIVNSLCGQNARLDRIHDAISHFVDPNRGREAHTRSLFRRSVYRLLVVQKAVAAFEGGYNVYDRLKILRWLSAIPYQQHQKQAYNEVQQGTGTWFLQDVVYRSWGKIPESSLLWLHGPPGCGKSKLMSLAIQEALKANETYADTRVLFFYCSGTPAEPERANPLAILRCLVKQGLTGRLGLEPGRVPRYVVQPYKIAERDGFASEGLALDECCSIISKYAIDHATTYIFLDALDECADEARYRLIQTLKEIIDRVSSSFVKVMVTSRDDVPLGTFFDKDRTLDIQVDGNRNQQDIDHYVQAQLSHLILQKRLSLLSRPISAELQETIAHNLVKGAKGMFRWVSVTLEYLCTLKTKRDIEDRLGRLPPGLLKSYGDLFRQRTEGLGEEHRRRLDLALSLLLLPRRPEAHIFRWLIFLDDVEEDCDDDDSNAVINADVSQGHILVREAISIERYDAVTQLSFNLVVFDKDIGVYRFAHTSVQEFLLEYTQGYYSDDVNHQRVAKHCLSILLHTRDHFRDNTRSSSKDEREPQTEWMRQQDQVLKARESQDSIQAYYYFRLPPRRERTVREDAVIWIRQIWAYVLLNSKQFRQSGPLKRLEVKLQELPTQQTFGSLRAMIFFQACRYGLKDFVKVWVKAYPELMLIRQLPSIDLSKTDAFMATALQSACYGGQTETVELLISEGAHIDYYSQSPVRTNALCIAIRECKEDVVKVLLEKGASPNTDPDCDVNYPMHYIIYFWKSNVMRILKLLVEHGADIDAEDEHGATAVVRAQMQENFEAMAFLLDNGARSSYVVPQLGVSSMLHLAVDSLSAADKPLVMIRFLLTHGVDVNFRDADGETPLCWALLRRHHWSSRLPEVIRLLLDNGAHVNIQDLRGRTPLIRTTHVLETHQSDQIEARDHTALATWSSAVHDLASEQIARMLCASGADPNTPDAYGWTALHHVADKGRADIAALLIDSNTQVNATTAWGTTALYMAAQRGYIDVVKVLIASGADPNITSQWGSSPLASVAENGHTDVTKLLLPITGDLQSQDGDGDTALSNAAHNGHGAVIRLLLDAGAEIVPNTPGPYCSFLSGRERLQGYGRDAILRSWQNRPPAAARMILERAAAKETDDEYSKVLEMWKAEDKAAVRSWMNERIANAPENRPETVLLRERVKAVQDTWDGQVMLRSGKHSIGRLQRITPI